MVRGAGRTRTRRIRAAIHWRSPGSRGARSPGCVPCRPGSGIAKGNKRTALLLARWTLDNNGLDGHRTIEPDDRELANLLVHAASGRDVEADVIMFFTERA